MSFATIEFFLFLAATFSLYYLHRGKSWQNTVLLVASYIFYAAWDYRFCSLMLLSSLIDYGAGWGILRTSHPGRRKVLLMVGLGANLALLGFFKYYDFFVDSLSQFLSAVGWEANLATLNIILPVGISFYTFQTMSYTIDIYRGQLQPQGGLVQYLTFVSFFPQLVAGPIERATHLLPQFNAGRVFSAAAGTEGVRLILYGLFCKMVLADHLGGIVERVYSHPNQAAPGELAVATIAFGFQIYFDFAAYSTIATGTARLFGIQLMRNFDYPYFSRTIREFWRRWHVSLSTWFRDYVYIPLGGSRQSLEITCRNLFLTFLLSGLWHGAAEHFVMWGVFHGVYITLAYWAEAGPLHRLMSRMRWDGPWLEPVRILRTFFLVMAAWVLFRASSVAEAATIYQRVGTGVFTAEFYPQVIGLVTAEWPVFLALAGTVALEWVHRDRGNPLPLPPRSRLARWLVYTGIFWLILLFGTQRTAEFIYFQF